MLSDRSRALNTAAAAFTAAAVVVALTVTGSAVATAATAGTTPASSGAAGIGTPVDFPGTTAPAPTAETLLSAGATGFLHQRAGSNDLLWTRYDTGATVTAFTLAPRVFPPNLRATIPGEFGTGSDVVAAFDWGTRVSVTLYDMGAGGAQTVVPLGSLRYDGAYGRTVVALGAAGTAAVPGVHLLTPDGSGGTKDVVVTGLPAAAAGRMTQVLAGDATSVVVQYVDSTGPHQALVDLSSAVATPIVLGAPGASLNPAQVALSPSSILFRAGTGGVQVFSRTNPSAAPVAVPTPTNPGGFSAPALAEVSGSVLTVQSSRAAATNGGALTATTEATGTNSSLLASTDDALLETPDGGALIAGSTVNNVGSSTWGFYRVAPGASGPATAELTPLYRAPSPVASLALERGTATVWSADSGTIWSRTLSGGAFGAPTRVASTGSASGPLIATGDGQVAFDDGGEMVKAGSHGLTAWIAGQSTGLAVDADGRYALSDSTALTASDFGTSDVLGPVGAPAKPGGRPGAVWGGFAYVGSGRPGAVTIEDLAQQRVAGVVDSGAPCVAPEVQVVGRWMYWTCDTHTAGILDMADGARYRLPATGTGYDDALLGDGFVVHHDVTAGQLVLDDIHTDADATTTAVAPLGGGTAAPDRDVAWTVDRYSAELGWHGDGNVFHVAPVTGVPASAAWTPTSKAPTVPAWLTPDAFTYGQGMTGFRECTGALIAPTRVLATADCYTGHSSNSFGWNYNRSTGWLNGGGSNPTYLLDQRYNATSRQDDVSVTRSYDDASRNVAVLAGAADGALYRAGTTATFYSWSTLGWGGEGGVRRPHAETVQLQSAATCSQLLGHALPSGSVCTTPAPGAAWVAPQDQCVGDAGGALVAGGKLIATSATPVGSCASGSVRVYTATAPKYALERGWSRDLGTFDEGLGFGGITARTADGVITSFCDSDMHGCLNGGTGILSDGFRQFNLVLAAGDMTGDGSLDLLIRSNSGALYRFWGLSAGSGDLDGNKKTLLGYGWNQYTRILAPGDLTGDGLTDVVAVDRSGVMWLYPGTANGGLGHRVRVGGGWNSFNLVAGHGDLTGDGIADLVARDGHGRLWTFVGNGHGGFLPHAVYAGSGWGQYNAIVLGGDLDGQGHQQLIARKPNGQCDLYTSNGAGGFGFTRAVGGNGWERYAQLS